LNAVLLAAGYGTRLYPLTKDRPKPLLPVGGRPILDHLVDRLEGAAEITRMVLVSNARFLPAFERWAQQRVLRKPLSLVSDGSTDNDNRLGAVRDMQLALDAADMADEPAYVLATDNLPRFDMLEIVALAHEKGGSAVFAVPVRDPESLRRMGVAELGQDGRVVGFQEKPAEPRGRHRVPPFYAYTPEAVASVRRFLDEGNDPDAPGHFLAWLVGREPVYAQPAEAGTYDIGTLESYRRVCREFGAGG